MRDDAVAAGNALGSAGSAAAAGAALEALGRSPGRFEAGQAGVRSAARQQEELSSSRVSDELNLLAQSLPRLSPAERADVAEALDKAAQSAQHDRELGNDFSGAAKAVREERLSDVESALARAGRRLQDKSANSGLDADLSRASIEVQEVKDALLESSLRKEAPDHSQSCSTDQGSSHDHGCSAGDEGSAHASSDGQMKSASQGKGSGGAGAGAGGGGGEGDGGGGHRGSGLSGAQGSLGERPGLPNEQVYVPSAPGPGRSESLPSKAGTATNVPLIPYERVYAQYRAAALTQADRQPIPERLRGLVRQYFQDPGS